MFISLPLLLTTASRELMKINKYQLPQLQSITQQVNLDNKPLSKPKPLHLFSLELKLYLGRNRLLIKTVYSSSIILLRKLFWTLASYRTRALKRNLNPSWPSNRMDLEWVHLKMQSYSSFTNNLITLEVKKLVLTLWARIHTIRLLINYLLGSNSCNTVLQDSRD